MSLSASADRPRVARDARFPILTDQRERGRLRLLARTTRGRRDLLEVLRQLAEHLQGALVLGHQIDQIGYLVGVEFAEQIAQVHDMTIGT